MENQRGCEKRKEGETDKQTDRQTDTDRHRHTDTQTHRHTHTQTHTTHTHRHTDTQTETDRDRQRMTTSGAALDKCHNRQGFEAWRQFVIEWEPKFRTRFVGLLMNVLSYRFRDDIPNKLAAFERLVHDYENQSKKTVDEEIKIGVAMLGMEDMRFKEHLIRNSVRITSWSQMREEILEITRTQQHIDSQPVPMHLGANPKRARAKAKMARSDDQKKCFYCNKTGHVNAECGKRQRDLAQAEGKPVAATPHPSDIATMTVPLQCLLPDESLTTTFILAMPCANDEPTDESSSKESMLELGAGCTAPEGTEHVRLVAANPSCEPYLMMDTCAGGRIFPGGFDQSAQDDSTVAPVQLATAKDDPVHGDVARDRTST